MERRSPGIEAPAFACARSEAGESVPAATPTRARSAGLHPSDHRRHRTRSTLLAAMALTANGCSFLSSRVPPSNVSEHVGQPPVQCSVWRPVADTLSSVAGATWVHLASVREDASRSSTTTIDGMGNSTTVYGEATSYQPLRILGYSTMVVFAASAIYGFVAESMCTARRREATERKSQPGPEARPVRPDFPGQVNGFTFAMRPQEAEQLCASQKRHWHQMGAVAACQPDPADTSAREVQLAFELGRVSRITVVYVAPPEQLRSHYEQLVASMRSTYGAPQIEGAAWPAACRDSVAACLKAGAVVKVPQWSWATGMLEVQPVWREDRATVDIRYTHQETFAP